jgi:hypothetical protein
MDNFSPGDVIINECMITGAQGGAVDVTRRVHSFQIYENLQKPYSAIQITIVDNTGLIDKSVQLNGKNFLSLNFQNPGQAPYTNTWLITSAEKSQHTQNLRTKIYVITAYSMHMERLPRVQRSFKNMSPTAAIQELIGTYLNPYKGFQIRDPARGMVGNDLMPFTINGQQIFRAIRNLMNQSASTTNDSSAYVLFEDSKALVLDTLENVLYKGLSSPVATYFQRPLGQDFIRDQALQAYTILKLKEDSRVDRTEQIQAESQAVRTFDMFAQTFQNLGTFFGGASASTGGASTYQNIAYNLLRPPSYAKMVADKRKWIASVFDSQSATIFVPFNSDLTVGCGYIIQSITPGGDMEVAQLDKLSGPLVATEVCHNVRIDRKKMMAISIVRGVTGRTG